MAQFAMEDEKKVAMIKLISRMATALRPNIKRYNPDIIANKMGLTPSSETHDDDVFVVGYPKSGNTWFQNLISEIYYNVNIKNLPQKVVEVMVPEIAQPYYRRINTPMFFKYHGLPDQRMQRVVYLLRDGRDVMVSYFHYRKGKGLDTDFMEMVTRPDLFPCPWHEHVEQWLANPYHADILIIRYEDMLTQPLAELQKFCDFVGIERTKEALQDAIEAASFDNMKARDQDYHFAELPPDQPFVRRGVSGSYKDEMPEDVLDCVMSKSREMLVRLGYVVGD